MGKSISVVDLCTIDKVKTTCMCWSRYGISVSTKTAAALGVVLSDELDYVLIPRAVSRQAYLYGDLPRYTPLAEIDPRKRERSSTQPLMAKAPIWSGR